MYCRVCGNPLRDHDAVCTVCGTAVEKPSKWADRKMEEKTEVQTDADIRDKAPEFTWNVYDFPKPRRTEDIRFDWGNTEEKTVQAPTAEEESETPANSEEDEQLSEEENKAEKALAEACEEAAHIFSFDEKNEAFQELLDREYDKIKDRDSKLPGAADLPHSPHRVNLFGTDVGSEPEEPEELGDDKRLDFSELYCAPIKEVEAAAPRYAKDPIPVYITGLAPETVATLREIKGTTGETVSLSEEDKFVTVKTIEIPAVKDVTAEEIPVNLIAEEPKFKPESGSEPEIKIAPETMPEVEIETESEMTPVIALAAKSTQEQEAVQGQEPLPPLWFEQKDEEEKEKQAKKHGIGRILLFLIVVILLVEIATLTVKLLAPDSDAAAAVTKAQVAVIGALIDAKDSIAGLFGDGRGDGNNVEEDEGLTGSGVFETDEEDEEETEIDTTPAADKTTLIEAASASNKNIKSVKADTSLAFKSGRDYGSSDINRSTALTDNVLSKTDDGETLLIDREIVRTLIAFDSQWIDYVNGGSDSVIDLTKTGSTAYNNAVNYSKVGKIKETFDVLSIGEIRKGDDGYYVWTYEEITQTANGKTTKINYHWIYYLEVVDGEMKIVNYIKY